MPNEEILKYTHTSLLKETKIPLKTRVDHLFPGLSKALISIGILCDHGCIAIFEQDNVTIINKIDGKSIMRGGRAPRSRLLTLTLQALNLRTCTRQCDGHDTTATQMNTKAESNGTRIGYTKDPLNEMRRV